VSHIARTLGWAVLYLIALVVLRAGDVVLALLTGGRE
jgi:hypothetical protein